MKNSFAFVALTLAAILTACGGNKKKDDINISGAGVYVLVNNNHLWKDGVAHQLTTAWTARVNSLHASGNDVYVAGQYDGKATLWKNGTRQTVSSSTNSSSSEAHSVFVVDSDVYVAGYVGDYYGNANATLWKNGTAQILSNSESTATSVFVSGNDVYVAGRCDGKATLWKNGTAQILSNSGMANAVFVSGSDVYVAVDDYHDGPTLWKNGVGQCLAASGSANSVFVSGNDVYVAGQCDDKATLWKNGVRQALSNNILTAAHSVFVSSDAVYCTGDGGVGKSIATLWKNGTAQQLPVGDYGLSIVVVE